MLVDKSYGSKVSTNNPKPAARPIVFVTNVRDHQKFADIFMRKPLTIVIIRIFDADTILLSRTDSSSRAIILLDVTQIINDRVTIILSMIDRIVIYYPVIED